MLAADEARRPFETREARALGAGAEKVGRACEATSGAAGGAAITLSSDPVKEALRAQPSRTGSNGHSCGLAPRGPVVRGIVIARDTVSVAEWCAGCLGRARPANPARFATIDAHGGIAQLVEHTTENRGVPGSSPGLAIT